MVYALGPQPETPVYRSELPSVPTIENGLEEWIQNNESKFKVKPNNEARIVWADSVKSRTEYCIVYLHGYSASQMEGDPVHRNIARRYGANLYLARLQAHGLISDNPLIDYSPSGVWESAQEALAIGQQLGDKIILMSTSTGGTLSLMLGAKYDNIYAHILYSPNIEINDPTAYMLNNPWGLQIARTVIGDEYRFLDQGEEYAKYWNDFYRIESLVALQELLETSMNNETFSKVTQPVYLAYYFKNEEEQDPVVKVSAMLKMYEALGTNEDQKRKEAYDTGNHVLASPIKSGDVEGVQHGTERFIEEVLEISPISEQ